MLARGRIRQCQRPRAILAAGGPRSAYVAFQCQTHKCDRSGPALAITAWAQRLWVTAA